MKTRDLVVLSVVLLFVVGLALLSQRHRSGAPRSQEGDLMFPALAVNDVAKIRFETADKTIMFERKKDTWTSPDTHDYPTDFEKVRTFLLALRDLKTGQLVTADEKQRAELQVISPKATSKDSENQPGTVVSLEDDTGKEIASLILGKTRNRKLGQMMPGLGEFPDGRYLAVGEAVYLVSSTLSNVPKDRTDWLADKLIDLYTADIMKLTVTGPKRDEIELERPEGGDLRFDRISRRKEMDSSKVSDLAGALSYLKFSDIADPALEDAELGMEKPVVTWRAETSKGMLYTVLIGSTLAENNSPAAGERASRYMRLSVAFEQVEDESDDGPVKDTKPDEEADKKPAEEDDLAETAESLNNRFSKWTYVIDGKAAESFLIAKDDLTRKKQKK